MDFLFDPWSSISHAKQAGEVVLAPPCVALASVSPRVKKHVLDAALPPLADNAFRLVDKQPLIPEYPEVTLPSKYKFACQTRLPPSLLYGYICRLSRLRTDYIPDANDKHQMSDVAFRHIFSDLVAIAPLADLISNYYFAGIKALFHTNSPMSGNSVGRKQRR
ncbi:hypothetical protein BO79DRAFT_273504 [Aspergillus costaricaensis CBS 115574]|uniref:Uncharacterized protein n=1 Tax=Aspergillus costaricaensis CBS 115574 TaxID=1448317 RepID=A0ACD1I4V7_9EURO|nr:hypothetical protein BO79DRAFT_273504 [Aspergillus costaricaensis CBS 115574]RAK85398.1 hypothetical protein BO79DRAFT_273504 [Aspergillus costaricaensis CBS 115574]